MLVQIDEKNNCCSVLVEMEIKRYLNLVEHAYRKKGGLKEQRPPLKTASAKNIRFRMVDDIKKGTVLPPVVIGVVTEDSIDDISSLNLFSSSEDLALYLDKIESDVISIIDGMQRTTAILDAFKDSTEVGNKKVRVEFWFSNSVSPLIYIMLILNTGQIPWDITRQLDTIYSSLISDIKKEVSSIEIYTKDEPSRRSAAGQFQSSHIIELYMIFSSRELDVDVKSNLQTDFARVNMLETSENSMFQTYFNKSLGWLVKFDKVFSKATGSFVEQYITEQGFDSDISWKVKCGQDIFKSAPARAGFIAAIANHLLDEPGFDICWSDVEKKFPALERQISDLLIRLESYDETQVTTFLSLDVLAERLSVKSGKVGAYERKVYFDAFSSMIRNSERISNMTPCWK